jgi:Family of unknown function (DUF5681)
MNSDKPAPESEHTDASPQSASSVGYGRPPQPTRFQKGISGNPKGRPKGSLNVATILMRTLREKVVINENGRRRTVTKLEAALKQLVNKAASGELRALQQLVMLANDAEQKEKPAVSQNPVINELDRKVMKSILKRFQPPTDQAGEHEECADGDHDCN